MSLAFVDVLVTYLVAVVLMGGGFVAYMRFRHDQFEREKWHVEMRMRERELAQRLPDRVPANAVASDISSARAEPPEFATATPYGGYVFVEIPDDHKSLFRDTITGFEEFARLKGYQVSIAIDTTPPGKVGFKFTILDQGITVSTSTVRSDVAEYVAQLTDSETFDRLPVVVDLVEHERLKAALTTRFAMIRSNAEMYKAMADFYKQFAHDMAQARVSGVGYLPAPSTVIHTQLGLTGGQVTGDSYSADHSPGAAVGKRNVARLEGSSITIGSIGEQRDRQIVSLTELIDLLSHSQLANKDDAVRYLANVREEINGKEPPDPGLVETFLNKTKSVLAVADKGSDIWKKANDVLSLFGCGNFT